VKWKLYPDYVNLNVYFDLWKKESDAQPYIPKMIEDLKNKGLAHLSNGALVVDVKDISDTKDVPPCILIKSDGSTLYSTTDLATIIERMELYNPDEIIETASLQLPYSENERNLMLKITHFNDVIPDSFVDYSSHKICQFIFELSNEFNSFYHETKIISEKDTLKQKSWIKLISLTKDVLVICLD